MQQCLILGKAVRDAEVLESKEGKTYARFSIAVSEYLGLDREERVTFYNCLDFGKTSANAIKVKKGDLVMVDGRPEVDAYISNEGEAKGNLVIIANRWKALK